MKQFLALSFSNLADVNFKVTKNMVVSENPNFTCLMLLINLLIRSYKTKQAPELRCKISIRKEF